MKRILVVDDSPLIRSMLQELLSNNGFDVILAEDGIQGAEIAYKEQPDLIFSDIEMPKMNGFQFCRLLKTDALTRNIPTIILTSNADVSSVFWGLETGADKYLLKNSSSEVIVKAAEELLALSRNRKKADKLTDINQWDIVEKVNNLLDDKLFETTILSGINNVIFDAKGIKDAVKGIFKIIQKILKYEVISFMAFLEEEARIFYEFEDKISESTFQNIQYLMFSRISNHSIDIPENIEIEVEGEFGEKELSIDLNNLFFLPIKVKTKTLGILTIITEKERQINDYAKDMIAKVKNAMSLVLDNIYMYEKIKNLSVIDPLTNIYNRRHFMDIFEMELARSERYNLDLSLIMFDIDNFKHINDTYNHLSGDMVLKSISAIIKQSIRKMDIPGRYGGEEFIVILPETNFDSGYIVAERIRKNVEEFAFKAFDGRPIKVTISVGLASTSDKNHYANCLEFINTVDAKLYEAKTTGKNKVCF